MRAPRHELLALALLAVLALALWWATPQLVVPYRPQLPWWESAAFFPRAALVLVALAALAEGLQRWRGAARGASDELDAQTVNVPRALAALALFTAYALAVPVLGFATSSALFLLATGRAVGLGWRQALTVSLPLALLLWAVFVKGLKVSFGHGCLF